jgi:DNA-binding MarR family transcriptional regulator
MSAHTHRSIKSSDASAHLQQLSDEVSRIAATLSRLSSEPQLASNDDPELEVHALPASLQAVKGAVRARRLRERYFEAELFADPAWDILLELLQAEIAQYRVSISSLCAAAHVPATTGLRWISTLTDSGLLHRRPDPNDGRRMFMELTPRASAAMHRYFAHLGKTEAA